MATPPPPPPTTSNETHLHIKSAARKLPIKRNPNPISNPIPNPNPDASPNSFSIIVDDGEGTGVDPDDDEDEDETTAATTDDSVPFKFHRIWSESDEVRFLQGLLACRSQGLVFPRDLNVFFDRFSETMTQPYTRSQLSEKLRRLRKKFRVVSARVARGLNPSTALSSHDRDLYHLSTQLWHPSYVDSSPFVASGPEASKRRRRLPPPSHPTINRANVVPNKLNSATAVPLIIAAPSAIHIDRIYFDEKDKGPTLGETMVEQGIGGDGGSFRYRMMKAVLDAFESSVKEAEADLVRNAPSPLDLMHSSGSGGDLLKKWQEQHLAELDVLARRLRLVIENAAQS